MDRLICKKTTRYQGNIVFTKGRNYDYYTWSVTDFSGSVTTEYYEVTGEKGVTVIVILEQKDSYSPNEYKLYSDVFYTVDEIRDKKIKTLLNENK